MGKRVDECWGEFCLMILGEFFKNMFVDFWLMFGLIFWSYVQTSVGLNY